MIKLQTSACGNPYFIEDSLERARMVGISAPRVDGTAGFKPEPHLSWHFSAEQLRAIADLLDQLNTRREA